MTFNEMVTTLYGFKNAKREFERSLRELEEVETMIQGLSIDYSKPRVTSSQEPDTLSGIVDRLIAIRNKCVEQGETATKRMEEVKDLIDSVEDEGGRDILSRRYISCQSWNQVAYELHTDKRWCQRIHDREVVKLCTIRN